jgi:hypothetical protein
MGKKSAPKPPDYTAAAQAQGESSREVTRDQTYANRPDQVTPYGSQNWETFQDVDPATGQSVTRWRQNTTLTPESQAALDSQLAITQGRSDIAGGMMDRVASEFSPVVDFGAFTPAGQRVNAQNLTSNVGGSQQYLGQAGDALMNQFTSRMDPRFQRDQSQMDATLRARGLKPGDEAYDNALQDMRQSQGDQFNQAMFEAQKLSSGEAQRMQGMDIAGENQGAQFGQQNFENQLTTSQYDTQLRQQQIAEELQQRGFTLNEINALLTGQQVNMPNMPNFSNATRANETNFMGAAQNQFGAEMDAYNGQNALFGSILGAVTSPFSFNFGNGG